MVGIESPTVQDPAKRVLKNLGGRDLAQFSRDPLLLDMVARASRKPPKEDLQRTFAACQLSKSAPRNFALTENVYSLTHVAACTMRLFRAALAQEKSLFGIQRPCARIQRPDSGLEVRQYDSCGTRS